MDRDLTKVVCMLIIYNKKAAVRGVFSHPQVKRFGRDIPEKGTTQKLKISKLTDFAKQVVYIGVVAPAESKSYSFPVIMAKKFRKQLVGL